MPAADYTLTTEGDGILCLALHGDWQLDGDRPATGDLFEKLAAERPRHLRLEASGLGEWDTGLMFVLYGISEWCDRQTVTLDTAALPEAINGLLSLARAVPEKGDAHQDDEPDGILAATGKMVLSFGKEFCGLLSFVGEASIACWNAVTKGGRYRGVDFWMLVQQTGFDALPIVTLLSFLVGLIFAFVGAVQLEALGASIFIADLVGISMTREMGAIMTAIILSGRTGASFAATLGSMKANEELDALQTLGISPVEFLVVPRILALFLMMPLLVLFSMFVGMVGGLVIAVGVLGLSSTQYIQQTLLVVDLTQFLIGLTKALVFAVLVSAAGCMRGLQAGGSSEDVGTAATSAVVTAITAIIMANAVFAIILNILGI